MSPSWAWPQSLLAAVMLALTYAAAWPSEKNRCGELRPLAKEASQENELVQEEHTRGGDPNWCRHARALLSSLDQMIEVIKTEPNHCQVRGDKLEALEKATHRLEQDAEGCP